MLLFFKYPLSNLSSKKGSMKVDKVGSFFPNNRVLTYDTVQTTPELVAIICISF